MRLTIVYILQNATCDTIIYKDTSTTHAISRLKRIIKELHKTYVFVPADKPAKYSPVEIIR